MYICKKVLTFFSFILAHICFCSCKRYFFWCVSVYKLHIISSRICLSVHSTTVYCYFYYYYFWVHTYIHEMCICYMQNPNLLIWVALHVILRKKQTFFPFFCVCKLQFYSIVESWLFSAAAQPKKSNSLRKPCAVSWQFKYT